MDWCNPAASAYCARAIPGRVLLDAMGPVGLLNLIFTKQGIVKCKQRRCMKVQAYRCQLLNAPQPVQLGRAPSSGCFGMGTVPQSPLPRRYLQSVRNPERSHQRSTHRYVKPVRLPSVEGMVPLSWLLPKTLRHTPPSLSIAHPSRRGPRSHAARTDTASP